MDEEPMDEVKIHQLIQRLVDKKEKRDAKNAKADSSGTVKP